MLFTKKSNGFFIEVGAYDGESNSITCQLADNGWRGVYVEPDHAAAERCRARHAGNNVEVLEMACGDRNGEITLKGSGQVRTGVKEIPEMWPKEYIERIENDWNEQITVPLKITSYLRDKYGDPDLLVVDVEGMDYEVLVGYGSPLPPSVVVETHEGSPEWMQWQWVRENVAKIDALFAGRNKTVLDDCNTLYEI